MVRLKKKHFAYLIAFILVLYLYSNFFGGEEIRLREELLDTEKVFWSVEFKLRRIFECIEHRVDYLDANLKRVDLNKDLIQQLRSRYRLM